MLIWERFIAHHLFYAHRLCMSSHITTFSTFPVLYRVNPPKIANKNIGTKTFARFFNHFHLLTMARSIVHFEFQISQCHSPCSRFDEVRCKWRLRVAPTTFSGGGRSRTLTVGQRAFCPGSREYLPWEKKASRISENCLQWECQQLNEGTIDCETNGKCVYNAGHIGITSRVIHILGNCDK